MKKLAVILCVFLSGLTQLLSGQSVSPKYPLGYSVDISKITDEKMGYAKSLGIEYIELAGTGALVDKKLDSVNVPAEWQNRIRSVKSILDRYGIKVWSVHMPFSQYLDLSLLNEPQRLKVIAAHSQIVKALSVLEPQVILFHPSYYLGLNKREAYAKQLIKSVHELYAIIKSYKYEMVVENMLGPSLTKGNVERPLLRSVEECRRLFASFPRKVGIAVDFCHIARPEKLILAFGSRVKTVHVSNGSGQDESHYLPCDERGANDWNAIFEALQKIKYKGVYIHEAKYKDEKELVDCYNFLWRNYQTSLTNKKI